MVSFSHLYTSLVGGGTDRTAGFPLQSGCCYCLGVRGYRSERGGGAGLSFCAHMLILENEEMALHENLLLISGSDQRFRQAAGIQVTGKLGPVTQGGFLVISQTAGLAVIAH